MNRTNEYRAKGFELLSLAESMNDPERRADVLRYARLWMSLTNRSPTCRLDCLTSCHLSLTHQLGHDLREAIMLDAQYYRAQSEFYAEMAEAIKRPDYQDRWLRLAQQWRELAEQADKQHEAIPSIPRRRQANGVLLSIVTSAFLRLLG